MKSDIIHQMAHIGKTELLQYLLRQIYADIIALVFVIGSNRSY